jgi:hypothetical protein
MRVDSGPPNRAPLADAKAREFLRKADPVLTRLIDERPDFRPRVCGRSTVGKALARLGESGRVRRSAGGREGGSLPNAARRAFQTSARISPSRAVVGSIGVASRRPTMPVASSNRLTARQSRCEVVRTVGIIWARWARTQTGPAGCSRALVISLGIRTFPGLGTGNSCGSLGPVRTNTPPGKPAALQIPSNLDPKRSGCHNYYIVLTPPRSRRRQPV